MLSSSYAMFSWDWCVPSDESKAIGAREFVRLAVSKGGGVWYKKGVQGAFRLCSKSLPGPKSSMLSLFLR